MTHKPLALVAVLVAVVLGIAACSSDSESDSGADSGETQPASESAPSLVSADEAANLIADDPDLVVIDVRTPEEYAQGHIEGALNINVESESFTSDIEGLVMDEAYLVYCRSGNRSTVAVEAMSADGFTDLYNMEDGIQDWVAAGYPIVAGT